MVDCLAISPESADLCGPETSLLLSSIGKIIVLISIGQSLAVDPIGILTVLLPVISFLIGSNAYVTAD